METTYMDNEREGKTKGLKGFPLMATVLFGTLAAAGTGVAASADKLATGFHQIVLAQIGSAIFAGGLAFFLIEMSRWARERNSEK